MSQKSELLTEEQADQTPSSPNDEAEKQQNQPDRVLDGKIEAALLTSDRAITTARLAELVDAPGVKAINQVIDRLNEQYEQTGRSFRIEQVAGGRQIMTLPEYADVLANLHKSRSQSKLSAAALETLAIIAYKQPILRAEIESIRGVACGEVLRSLMDRHLVKIVGRAEELGRPMLYGTTKSFLEVFGLSGLKDLPKVEELREKTNQSQHHQEPSS